MAKIRTHKASAKRFSVTKNGKVKMTQQGRRHQVHLKTTKRKRALRKAAYISDINKRKLQRAWEAIERMRASAIENGIADMPMEEIDEEIRLCREERRARKNKED